MLVQAIEEKLGMDTVAAQVDALESMQAALSFIERAEAMESGIIR